MKKVIHIILLAVIVGAGIFLWRIFRQPVKFDRERTTRETVVTGRLRQIRDAQNIYLARYERYCGDIDSLVNFILVDSVHGEREGLRLAARSILDDGRLTDDEIKDLKYIPFAGYQPFYMEAGHVDTYGGGTSPVFECRAPFKAFLHGLNEQELINLIDRFKTRGEYPGLMIGSMEKPLYDGGNWEQ